MQDRPPHLRLPHRLATRIKTRGFGEIVDLVTGRVQENVRSDDELIFFMSPAGAEPVEQEGLVFRRTGPEDASLYARDIGTDSATSFRGRLTERTRCYIVELEGRVVHSSWVTLAAAWTRELRSYIRPPDGDAYIYESFTRADTRGRGVYPFALRNIRGALAREDVKRVWVAVEADNPASMRAVTKAGFEEAFRIAYGRRLGLLRVDDPTGPMADIGRTFRNRQAEGPRAPR